MCWAEKNRQLRARGQERTRNKELEMGIPKLKSYWQYVEYWASIEPQFPALREDNRTVTSKEFNETTDQLAMAFIKIGVRKGDRIATILPSGINYVLTLIAAGKIGAIVVPLDVKFRIADLNRSS